MKFAIHCITALNLQVKNFRTRVIHIARGLIVKSYGVNCLELKNLYDMINYLTEII